MKKNIALLIFLAAAAYACSTPASASRKGIILTEGLVYGENYSFLVSAPGGWVLDNDSGVEQGLQAVFYPKGSSWKDSQAVMFVNTAPRKDGDTLAGFMKKDLAQIRENGSPDLLVEPSAPIRTRDGKAAEVSLLSGGQWKNHEAVAYIQERTVFVMIVLNSRTQRDFRLSWDAFRSLVGSYRFWTEDIHLEK